MLIDIKRAKGRILALIDNTTSERRTSGNRRLYYSILKVVNFQAYFSVREKYPLYRIDEVTRGLIKSREFKVAVITHNLGILRLFI